MKALFSLLLTVLPMIGNTVIDELSPDFRKMITNTLGALKDKAEKTKNPFDDIAVGFLYRLFDKWIK